MMMYSICQKCGKKIEFYWTGSNDLGIICVNCGSVYDIETKFDAEGKLKTLKLVLRGSEDKY